MSKQAKKLTAKTVLLRISYFFLIQPYIISQAAYSDNFNNNSVNKLNKKIVTISVKPLETLVLQTKQSAPARIVSLNQSQLSAQISATVKKINVDIGDQLKKGSVLVELDCRDYHYAAQQAKATYLARKAQASFAKKKFFRHQKLIKQATIPQTSLEQAESDHLSIQEDLKALKAHYKNTQLNIERCTLKAPFAGQVTQRYVQQGQLVSPNTPIVELLQTAKLYVIAELSRQKTHSVKQAKQVLFSLNKHNTLIHLDKVVSLIKTNTQTQTTRFSFIDKKNKKHQHIAGETGRIVWQHSQKQLPADYLSQRNNQLGVLIAHRKKEVPNQAIVKFIPLKYAQEGQAANINLPLKSLIIDKGRLYVNDKQTVIIQ